MSSHNFEVKLANDGGDDSIDILELEEMDVKPLFENDKNDTKSLLAEMSFMEAEDLRVRGDLNGAIRQYRTTLEYNPKSIECNIALAEILAESANTKTEAIQLLEQALKLLPDDARLRAAKNKIQSALTKPANTTKLVEKRSPEKSTTSQLKPLDREKSATASLKVEKANTGQLKPLEKSATGQLKTINGASEINGNETADIFKEIERLEKDTPDFVKNAQKRSDTTPVYDLATGSLVTDKTTNTTGKLSRYIAPLETKAQKQKFSGRNLLILLALGFVLFGGLFIHFSIAGRINLIGPSANVDEADHIVFNWDCNKVVHHFVVEVYDGGELLMKQFVNEKTYTPDTTQKQVFQPEHDYTWRVIAEYEGGGKEYISDYNTFQVSKAFIPPQKQAVVQEESVQQIIQQGAKSTSIVNDQPVRTVDGRPKVRGEL